MDSLSLPAVCASRSMHRARALLAAACFAASPAQANAAPDGAGPDLPDIEAINRKPIVSAARGAAYHAAVKPSFAFKDTDGTQVQEYRFKGQAPDIHVQSGLGTSYQMSRSEGGAPRIPERDDVSRVPSIKLLNF